MVEGAELQGGAETEWKGRFGRVANVAFFDIFGGPPWSTISACFASCATLAMANHT